MTKARTFSQAHPPLRAPQGPGVWLVGVRSMAHDPSGQWVAHHFCQQLQPDLMQCVLYSSSQPDAKLTGSISSPATGSINFQRKKSSTGIRITSRYGAENALDGQFKGETSPVPGVEAKEQGCPEYPFATQNQ